MIGRVLARLRRAWYGERYLRDRWSREERIAYLEQAVEYLSWQASRQAVLIRRLAAPLLREISSVDDTKRSFDFQWSEIPTGRHMLEHPAFRAEAAANVCRFTGLPREWFAGKRVIDVGCGLGRYSWALCELGARVLSLDQSAEGLRRTIEACRAYAGHEARQVDLLEPLPFIEPADLVWSFGVLHHTGDTFGGFRRIVPLVKPGGYLYLMIYGEPRDGVAADLEELNEYERWRHRTANLPLAGKLAAIRAGMDAGAFALAGDEHVHGYFDAIAPTINDLHAFDEIESWLIEAGFEEITRTVAARNLHIRARRRA